MPDINEILQSAFPPDVLATADATLDWHLAHHPVKRVKTSKKSVAECLPGANPPLSPYDSLQNRVSALHQDGHAVLLGSTSLGKGSFGRVKVGLWKANPECAPKLVVVKIMQYNPLSTKADKLTHLYQNEARIAKDYHIGIAGPWFSHDIKGLKDAKCYIILEYAGPSLKSLSFPHFSLTLRMSIMLGVLREVLRWHSGEAFKSKTPRVHLDLKPENICVTIDEISHSITIKLIDFGLSRLANDDPKRIALEIGSPNYLPINISDVIRYLTLHNEMRRGVNIPFSNAQYMHIFRHAAQIQHLAIRDLIAAVRTIYFPGDNNRAVTDDLYQRFPDCFKALLNTSDIGEYLKTLSSYYGHPIDCSILEKYIASWTAYLYRLDTPYISTPYITKDSATATRIIKIWDTLQTCSMMIKQFTKDVGRYGTNTVKYQESITWLSEYKAQSLQRIRAAISDEALGSIVAEMQDKLDAERDRILGFSELCPIQSEEYTNIDLLGVLNTSSSEPNADLSAKYETLWQAIPVHIRPSDDRVLNEWLDTEAPLNTRLAQLTEYLQHPHIAQFYKIAALPRETAAAIKGRTPRNCFFCKKMPHASFAEVIQVLEKIYLETSMSQRALFFDLDTVQAVLKPYISTLRTELGIEIPEPRSNIRWKPVLAENPFSAIP